MPPQLVTRFATVQLAHLKWSGVYRQSHLPTRPFTGLSLTMQRSSAFFFFFLPKPTKNAFHCRSLRQGPGKAPFFTFVLKRMCALHVKGPLSVRNSQNVIDFLVVSEIAEPLSVFSVTGFILCQNQICSELSKI